ncbi:substrate-binding domain-containing protein [Streptomyces sp. GC420]|uniref:substrate-binding domain-containing protein n=1 Tax=Streptomyces sp. GC420 TaxID=2697568 RepID=UPI0014150B05|nr:substrate-binding domain-containing protein [Streptomyces sp. GC420]NBM15750.1 solute-binding protein [Streptomyces sp. GC420]
MASPTASRAVLIGVDSYLHPEEFTPIGAGRAARNLEALREVLTRPGTGLLLPSRVHTLLNPRLRGDIERAIDNEQRKAAELLIYYYVGHGYLPPGTDQLYLTVSGSTRDGIESSALSLADLISQLEHTRSRRVVLILDCCFSGGLPGATVPDSKPFSVLTSSPKRMLISCGAEHDRLTPFTAKLVEVLGEGVSRHEFVTVLTLGTRLDELAREPENAAREDPWFARQLSSGAGAETVLSLVLKGPRYPLRQRVRRWVRRLTGHLTLPWQWFAGPVWPNRVLGALTVLAVLAAGTVAGVRLAGDEPCDPPLELRMVTAPEEVEAMTAIAETYERSSSDGCRTSRIGVYGAGLDTLAEAFRRAGDWGSGRSEALGAVGPQPDLWLAQSSAEVEHVRGRLAGLPAGEDRAGFLRGTPVAADLPVLALTESGRKSLGLPRPTGRVGTTSWPRLRAALAEAPAPVRLLRPNPTVSGTGLVHTLGMYGAEPPDGPGGLPLDEDVPVLPDKVIRQLETEVIGLGRSLTDSTGTLCELARGGAAGALVSQRQAERRGNCPGSGPDADGTGGGARDGLHLYEIDGLPPLDYPLVSVSWPAADRTARDAAVTRFRHWLAAEEGLGALADQGYGGPRGTTVDLGPVPLEDRLARFRAAHPDLRLSVLFDVSGSMRQRDRYTTARSAVEEALRRLGSDDRYELRTFPARPDGGGTTTLVRDWRGDPASGRFPLTEDALRPGRERQADLLQALERTAEPLRGQAADGAHQYAILLVTDGDYVSGEPPRTAELRARARSLGAEGIPVLVASMRPYGCSDTATAPHEPGALATASGGACAALSADLPARLSGQVAALTEGRRR